MRVSLGNAALIIALFTLPRVLPASPSFSPDAAQTNEIDMPIEDVLQAVDAVTKDQIIHGTYSYEKEKILMGAHSAESCSLFGATKRPGKVLCKVAEDVLAPRFFEHSADLGTIAVRYIVAPVSSHSTSVSIEAIFVEKARRVVHESDGTVESAEYAAVQEHVQTIARQKQEEQDARTGTELEREKKTHWAPPTDAGVSSAALDTTQELEQQVETLRRKLEMRVKNPDTVLRSAPFSTAVPLQPISSKAEVVILILTRYWYGVETEDGARGWVQIDQLEPLP